MQSIPLTHTGSHRKGMVEFRPQVPAQNRPRRQRPPRCGEIAGFRAVHRLCMANLSTGESARAVVNDDDVTCGSFVSLHFEVAVELVVVVTSNLPQQLSFFNFHLTVPHCVRVQREVPHFNPRQLVLVSLRHLHVQQRHGPKGLSSSFVAAFTFQSQSCHFSRGHARTLK